MLSIAGVLLTVIALIVSVILSENETEKIISHNRIQINEQNKMNMKTIVQGVYNSVQIYDKLLLSKLNDGLGYMRSRFQASGNLNQMGAVMNFNPKEPSPIVDDVSRLHEVHATIFRKLADGSMLRISTSIVRDGKRFVNTKISPINDDGSPNAVLQSVLKGNRYVGRDNVGEAWVNAIYEPIVEKNEVIGMLFVGSLESDANNFVETIKSLKYGEKGSVFAVGGKGIQKGILLISIDGEMDYQKVWNLTNSNGEYYWRKIIETGSSLPGNSAEYLEVDYRNKNEQEYKLAIVEMYYAPWDWVIGISVPKEEAEKASMEMQNSLNESIAVLKRNIYFTGITMLVLILIVSSVFSKNLTRTIDQAIVLFGKIAKGNMTHRLDTAKDDMGEMVSRFNELMDNMHEFMKKVMDDTSNLNVTSGELFSVSGQVEDISDRIVMRSNMIASTTEQMVIVINVIASTIERMSTDMRTTAGTVKEMSSAIDKITNIVEEIHQIAIGAKSKVTNATGVMGSLSMTAKEIGEVTEVIKRIAEKTNILALNATIEAAYAGEAGKSFAVVAAEIKELANQSTNSANYITQRIENIRNGTKNAVNVIHDVSNIILKIGDSVEAITGSVEQQPANTAIISNVAQTNAMVRHVAETINDIAYHSNEVSRNVSEVAKGVANVNSNVLNMNQISEEIKQGSTQVHQRSKDLEKIATGFEEMLNIYKV